MHPAAVTSAWGLSNDYNISIDAMIMTVADE